MPYSHLSCLTPPLTRFVDQAEEAAKMDETAPIPLHLRNAPTKMMKDMKYGEGYLYNPDYRHALHSVISVNTGTNF